MNNTKSFTDQKPRIATREDVHARWSGGATGKYFRCALCGHKFKVGDTWRFVYTNDTPGAGGNPLVCETCDGTREKVIEKWKALKIEFDNPKFWRFKRNRE